MVTVPMIAVGPVSPPMIAARPFAGPSQYLRDPRKAARCRQHLSHGGFVGANLARVQRTVAIGVDHLKNIRHQPRSGGLRNLVRRKGVGVIRVRSAEQIEQRLASAPLPQQGGSGLQGGRGP